MNTYVVWVEMDQAKVFKMGIDGTKVQILRRSEMKHHTSRDSENHKNCEKFFHDIATVVQDADELLLLGPSLTKEHFKSHLEHHHHETIAKKIIGMKTMDLTSDSELIAYSREFFRKYDKMEQPITA